MHPQADDLFGFVDHRSDVDVLAEPTEFGDALDVLDDLVFAVADAEPHDLRALEHTFHVVANAEQVECLVVPVPVTADALEYGRAVVERVRHHADLGVLERNELPLEECGWVRHPRAPSIAAARSQAAAR